LPALFYSRPEKSAPIRGFSEAIREDRFGDSGISRKRKKIEEVNMENTYPDFPQMASESACSMLNNPGLLSEHLIAQVVARRHKGTIPIQEAKELIEDYFTVLCERRT